MEPSTEQRLALEQQLRQRRAAVLAELRSETHADDGTMRLPSHRDETDAEITFELDAVDLAQSLRDDAELKRIDAALARLADGSYGECPDCGDPIDAARLHAEPTALRCTNCQIRFERTHAAV
jgi:DnaK suppressor protein